MKIACFALDWATSSFVKTTVVRTILIASLCSASSNAWAQAGIGANYGNNANPPPTTCPSGSICPKTALGAIYSASNQCLAVVYRCESCVGNFTVADLPCNTQPGACDSSPCNCSTSLTPVPAAQNVEPDPTAIAKRFWNSTLANSLQTADNFNFSDQTTTLVSTKYLKATTATGQITLRLEEFKQKNGDVSWGTAFKHSSNVAADAEIASYAKLGTSKMYVVRIKNSDIAYVAYLPVEVTAIP